MKIIAIRGCPKLDAKGFLSANLERREVELSEQETDFKASAQHAERADQSTRMRQLARRAWNGGNE